MLAPTKPEPHRRRIGRTLALIVPLIGTTGITPGCGVIQEVIEEQLSDTDPDPNSSSDGMDSTADTTGMPPDGDDETTSSSSSSDTGAPPADPPSQCFTEGLGIPDDGRPAESVIVVDPPAGPSTLAIGIRVTHPDISQLRIELLDGAGATIVVLDQPDCEGPNIDAFFTDAATVHSDGECLGMTSAIQGDVRPLESLLPLAAVTDPEPWTLRVQDLSAGDLGTLESWCIVHRPAAESEGPEHH